MNKTSRLFVISLVIFSLCLSILDISTPVLIPTVEADSTGVGFNMFTNAVDVSIGALSTWTDVDCSAYIPSGSTGAILEIHNLDASNVRSYDVRHPASTDDFSANIGITAHGHEYAIVGINSSRCFEGYVNDLDVDFYLIGYTDSDVTMLTNGVDVSLGVTGSWEDIDCSATVPSGATGVIIKYIASGPYEAGVRHPSSTDTFREDIRGVDLALCGVNSSRMIQGNIESTNVDFYIIGYTEDPVYFNVNWADVSLGSAGAWTEFDVTSETYADAVSVVMFIQDTSVSALYYEGTLRSSASSQDRSSESTIYAMGQTFGFCEMNITQGLDGWIENTAIDFYVVAYCRGADPSRIFPDHVETSSGVTDANNILDDDGSFADFTSAGWIILDFASEIANVTEIQWQCNTSVTSNMLRIETSINMIDWSSTIQFLALIGAGSNETTQTSRYDSEIHGRFRYVRITHLLGSAPFSMDFFNVLVSPPFITYSDATYDYPSYLYYFNWEISHTNYQSRPYNTLGENMTSGNPDQADLNETLRLVNIDFDSDNYIILRFSDYYDITALQISYNQPTSSGHTYVYIGTTPDLEDMTLVYDYAGIWGSGWTGATGNWTRIRYVRIQNTAYASNYIILDGIRIQGSVWSGTGAGDTSEYEWTFVYFPNWLADALGISDLGGQLLASAVMLSMFLLPFAFYERRSYWATIIVGVVVLSFLVAITWLPSWIMLVLILIVAGLFGKRFSDWFAGR